MNIAYHWKYTTSGCKKMRPSKRRRPRCVPSHRRAGCPMPPRRRPASAGPSAAEVVCRFTHRHGRRGLQASVAPRRSRAGLTRSALLDTPTAVPFPAAHLREVLTHVCSVPTEHLQLPDLPRPDLLEHPPLHRRPHRRRGHGRAGWGAVERDLSDCPKTIRVGDSTPESAP